MLRNSALKRTWCLCSRRYASRFVDPFGAKDLRQRPIDENAVREHNSLKSYSKTVGDPQKGLADDTSVHPFGDLRINFARIYSSNLCLWWEYDFTGGQILDNGQNALLSNSTKEQIYAQHQQDPQKWSVESLATTYGVRQQRIMAILSLKERAAKTMPSSGKGRRTYNGVEPPALKRSAGSADEDEAADVDEGAPVEEADAGSADDTKAAKTKTPKAISDADWLDFCDWAERHVFGATADRGSGERHFVSVPTYPKFEEIPLSEAHKYTNTEWDISRVNRLYTAKEDRFQIRGFRERLEMNTGKIGKTLDFKTDRTRMHRSPPKHDAPIVITSLDEDTIRPYVAEPDGTQRRLSPDEFLLWKRNNREAFTKLVEKQIERDGKRDEVHTSVADN